MMKLKLSKKVGIGISAGIISCALVVGAVFALPNHPEEAKVSHKEKIETSVEEETPDKSKTEDVAPAEEAAPTEEVAEATDSTNSTEATGEEAQNPSKEGKSKSNKGGKNGSTPAAPEAQAPAQTSQKNESGVYKYCPSSIDGNVFYCSNAQTPGEVKDGIYLNGSRVLTTSAGSWDSVQVCDPSVVAGDFQYGGQSYRYLMAYLGCATYDCTNNEVGLAVSNDLYNWTKTGKVVGSSGGWGVGQPSLINKDGNILLFYTSGTPSLTTTYVRLLNCSDLGNVQCLEQQRITTGYDFISNADFAYSDGTLYMTCDTHPFTGDNNSLGFISSVQSVYSASWDGNFSSLGSLQWGRIAQIGKGTTGHDRNHNGCFVRDSYGNLASREIYVSTGDVVGSWSDNLYTYRFQRTGF